MPPPLTRGPLPAGVYWRRRVFVLALAATLVFVIANVLGGGSDAKDDDVPVAQQAGNDVEASQTITVEKKKGRKGKRARGQQQGPTFDPAVMVDPSGNCEPADVRITPRIESAVAGEPVTIGLALQTVQSGACYFRVGADKVTVKITRRGRPVWTSSHCRDAVPAASVVVRRTIATVVEMEWTPYPQGTRRGKECPGTKNWLMPNGFTVTAAALGGEPGESDFELVSPTPETVTVTPNPKRDRKGNGDRDRDRENTDNNVDNNPDNNPESTDDAEPRR